MSAFKQLVIQSLVNSPDLQQEIMSFAFIDQKEKSRRIKNTVINDINQNLKYHRYPGNYWLLSYKNPGRRDHKAIGGQICGLCGLYYASHNQDELTDCVKCNCWDSDIE
jgi:hypothetical protein